MPTARAPEPIASQAKLSQAPPTAPIGGSDRDSLRKNAPSSATIQTVPAAVARRNGQRAAALPRTTGAVRMIGPYG
ncbi:hypothetical protein ACIA5C_18270 [Actinoplanes sp. NPDC051343]|uniref:hypothetical protein n=1 Tax=Actinoplanes sp. NPDC051343 TaxID=3363906 RepID=UPI003793D52D